MRSFTLLGLFIVFCFSTYGQIYIMDGTPIDACDGFFLDSGGGNGDYGANESFTTTICSDGSSGTHVKLNFSGVSIGDGDMLCFFDGPDATAPQLSCHDDFLPGAPFIIQATVVNPSGCVTITFNSDGATQGEGWSADISCIPACQTILATLISTDPIISPPDTGYIDICPGDRVFFNATGEYPQDGIVYNHSDLTSSFFWDFGDGSTAVGPNTSHVYDEPGGYVVELFIEDQFGCTNTNFISQRIRVSTYPDFELAGDIPEEICAGDTISLSALVTDIDSTFEVSVTPTEGGFPTGGVRSDSLPLPDGTGATYSTSIIFNNFAPGQVLTDVNDLLSICVNMEHSWMHDLQIELICPDGTTVVLQQQVFEGQCFLGIPNEDDEGFDPPLQGVGWDYCWTPNATNGNWTQYWQNTGVGTLPSDDYNAFGDLSDFVGCPLNGEWTIVVQDLWGIDNGWIFEWSINFAPELYPDVETFTPQILDWQWENNPTIVYYSNDSITAALNNAGNPSYTFTVTDDFGCSYDTTVVVDVLPPTHPSCFQCEPLTIATELMDSVICEGEDVSLDASTDDPLGDQAVTFEAFSNTEFDGGTFPPGNPINSPIAISYINPDVLTDPFTQIESVCLNIEHSFTADVEIRLQAPNGVVIELSTDNGGSGDDYTNTCFTPSALTPITAGSPPFTGNWQPEGNWNDLVGTSITGDWVLLVADDQNGFGGEFIDWSITFNTVNEVNYFWSPAATLSCNNCPDPVASPAVTTDYIVNAVDFFGCTLTDTVTISILEALEAPVLSCGFMDNGSLTIDWLDVLGASGYEVSLDGGLSWLAANGALSHTVNGLTDGEVVDILVRATVANSNCPPAEANLMCTYMEEPCALVVDTSTTIPPSCWNTSDATVLMSAMGGIAPVNYSLDGGPVQGPDFSDVAPGMHTVVAVDDVGCMDSITFEIIAPDTIFLTLTTDSVTCTGACDGQATVMAVGGTGAFSYEWNTVPASFDATVTGLCFDNYTVNVMDANGCAVSDNITVEEPINLLITSIITNNISCFGAADGDITVTPFGGTPPYSYQWDDPDAQITQVATGLSPGVYNVTITDANGCSTTGNAGVTEPAEPINLVLNQTYVGCSGAMESEATVSAMGGTGDYSYEWSNGDITMLADELDAINYVVTVTDANACTAVENIQIDELDPISVSLSGDNPMCFGGADGSVEVTSVTGGASGYTYEWNTTPVQTGTEITGLSGGVQYTVIVTDVQGCTGTASYSMGEPAEIQASTSSIEPSCSGFTDGQATVVDVQGGTPGYTYQWDSNAGNQTGPTAISIGSGIYDITITDSNGCTAVTQAEVTEPVTMQLNISTVDNFCPSRNQGSVDLTVIGGTPNYEFLWDNGETAQNLDSLWSATYYVTVTDANGCFVTDSANVNGPPPLEAIIETDAVSCFGEDDGAIIITLNGGNPPYRYSLDNVEFTGSNILIGLESGNYDLYAVDVNGCTWSSEAFVDSPGEFTVDAGADQEILLGDSVQLSPGSTNGIGDVTYIWSEPYPGTLSCFPDSLLDCENPMAQPETSITYELYGVDENGCEHRDRIMVRVIKKRDVYVATGFTPNGDGTNDLLMVHGPEETIVRLFRVFDRWGNMVFEYDGRSLSEDLEDLIKVNNNDFGWDGNFRGEAMGSGVFVWYVEVEYIDGFTNIFRGNTALIRN